MEAAVDFVTDIAKELGESFIKNGFHLLEHYSSLFSDVIAGAVIPWKLIELPQGACCSDE
jgi:hypothetical protein